MIGKTIAGYQIVEKLGAGGMGEVYKARDTRLDRLVAIKCLPRNLARGEEARERLKSEAKAAAALNHPNIATIYGIEEVDDPDIGREIFIIMEYIEGQELAQAIPSLTPPVVENKKEWAEETGKIAIQIAEGLQAAHKKGIVHRDIKSSNIMITPEGKIKIMDFGLAKFRGSAQLTQLGTTVGTVAYMSPEQAHGEETDRRTDIWSFGIVLYELLTGRLPFSGNYEQAIIYSLLHEDPVPPQEIRPDIPPHLLQIIDQCLQKDRENRIGDMQEVLDLLQNHDQASRSGLSVAAGVEKSQRSFLKPYSRRLPVFAGAVLILALVIFLMPSGYHYLTNLEAGSALPEARHLAVLPLVNIGEKPDEQAFCDGLVETLTSKLTQVEQFHGSLWVVPSSEVRRNQISSPGEAHQTFGANLAVTGSLQLFDNKYRLNVNLVDAENLRQLNSFVIDVAKGNATSLQEKTVSGLLNMLRLELKPELKKVLQAGGTASPGANEFYLQGRGYLLRYEDEKNIDTAVQLFRRALEKDSTFALAHAALGEAYWRKFEANKETKWIPHALASCNTAMRLNDQLGPVYVTLGLIHTGTGEYQQAVENFEKALEIDDRNAAAYQGLGRAYEEQNQLDKVEDIYLKAITLKPDYWAGYNELGAFYYRQGRYEEAINQFRQVVALTPDNYRGYNNLGAIYYLMKRWENAREMFEKSLALNKSYSVTANLGTLYYIEGKFADAAKMYEDALKLNKNDYMVWGNLGAAYHRTELYKENAPATYRKAITLAEERLQVNPTDYEVLSHLAGYYSMLGNRDQTLTYIKMANKASPQNILVMYRTGAAYEQLGDRKEAIHWLCEAIKKGYSREEIENQPELQELISDPRYREALNKMNTISVSN
ncbi:MAG: protein kinase [Calditrichia bacterium]